MYNHAWRGSRFASSHATRTILDTHIALRSCVHVCGPSVCAALSLLPVASGFSVLLLASSHDATLRAVLHVCFVCMFWDGVGCCCGCFARREARVMLCVCLCCQCHCCVVMYTSCEQLQSVGDSTGASLSPSGLRSLLLTATLVRVVLHTCRELHLHIGLLLVAGIRWREARRTATRRSRSSVAAR
jgi:hypothetical protein